MKKKSPYSGGVAKKDEDEPLEPDDDEDFETPTDEEYFEEDSDTPVEGELLGRINRGLLH